MPKILVVEDDADLAEMMSSWFGNERYTVEVALDGSCARDLLKASAYDVIVLDWDLPGCSGIDVLQEFRAGGGHSPVIMLTGKSEIADKEAGLGLGADDYLTKPFAIRELGARVQALLRRPPLVNSAVLQVGKVELDIGKHRVLVAGEEVHLLPRDFALLEFFLRHKDQVFSGEALIERVWSSDSDATPEGLRTAIKRIRKKIDGGAEETRSMIETIPRVGYRLRLPR
ncbi:MAG: response regulator transcription factor [Cyanobacteria bacterium SZAS TMP-1]|nr:response regulator transcription factor [Cyanobacteria bacterium SZAS TMP-1]